jgi:acetylornithine deacetylase/succinyl-diaminopimelate desuccinylase-like protein
LLRRLHIAPVLDDLGFDTEVLDNPRSDAGPVLIASRLEDYDKPTVLIYGHGDVVRGFDNEWRAGLDPWKIIVDGDRIYGRGTADNKGKHLIAIEALRAVSLGFNAKASLKLVKRSALPASVSSYRATASAVRPTYSSASMGRARRRLSPR